MIIFSSFETELMSNLCYNLKDDLASKLDRNLWHNLNNLICLDIENFIFHEFNPIIYNILKSNLN
jgi:hypothetical protein